MVQLRWKRPKIAAQGTSSGTQSTLRLWTYQRRPPHQAWFQANPGRKWPANRFDKLSLMNQSCSQDLPRHGSNLEDHAANAAKTVDANLGCLGSHEHNFTTKYRKNGNLYQTSTQFVLHLQEVMMCHDNKIQKRRKHLCIYIYITFFDDLWQGAGPEAKRCLGPGQFGRFFGG